LIWGAVCLAVLTPIALAAASPQLAWRGPIYIAAGFAGIAGLGLLLIQPLLAGGWLPGLRGPKGRRVHRWIGLALILTLIIHVGGLWLTSPPDVIDALTFTSPTPFSDWGVIAMWALIFAAVLATLRRRIPARVWRLGHSALVVIAVIGTVVHAMLIIGAMEVISKAALSALTLGVTAKVIYDLRAWTLFRRKR
jgi:predicted ferric reductase